MSKPFDMPAEDARYPRQHTIVKIPMRKSEDVVIFDHYPGQIPRTNSRLPVEIWKFIEPVVTETLNARLRGQGLPWGKFGRGDNRVERLLAKEMLALVWAVEPKWVDESMMRLACKNWALMPPADKWWLVQQCVQFRQSA